MMKTIEKDGFLIEINDDGDRKIIGLTKPIETAVLTIPDDVTEIADKVFVSIHHIEKVILPKTLYKIGRYAFYSAKSLKEINLDNVKEIGDCVFYFCDSLEKISLKCDKIGTGVFTLCKSLTEAEVDCEIIRYPIFRGCFELQKVVLKNTRILGENVFIETKKLKEIVLPHGLEEIGDKAFSECGAEVLTIPKTVRHIGRNIADGIKEIHIYDNIESDIGLDNDISEGGYTLYVHSAESDEIKYVVPIVGYTAIFSSDIGKTDHEALVKMFKGGVNFDFKKFDSYFSRISDEYALEKFNAGILRLKYGYELDEEAHRMYEEQLARLAPLAMELYIDNNKIEELFDPVIYECLSIEQTLSLIELSARKNQTELTAFLMQVCNEKGKGD